MTITYSVTQLRKELAQFVKAGEINKARHIIQLLSYSRGTDYVVVNASKNNK